jgi:hypothetical protein
MDTVRRDLGFLLSIFGDLASMQHLNQYRIDNDAIVILEVFEKKAQKTIREVIENCKRRIRVYDTSSGENV